MSPHPRSPVTKFEPDDGDAVLGDGLDGVESGASGSEDDDSEIEQLIAPTRHLVVRCPCLACLFLR